MTTERNNQPGQTTRILNALDDQIQTLPPADQAVVTEILDYLTEMAVDDLATQFQIFWETGTNPGTLTLETKAPSAATLKAALKQPGISRARTFLLEKILQGQEAAEIAWDMDHTSTQREPDLLPRAPTPPTTEEIQTFLATMLAEFHRSWRTNPLFRGAMRQIVDEKPQCLMARIQNPEHPLQLNLAPLIILMILIEGGINQIQQAREIRMRRERLTNWDAMEPTLRTAAMTEIQSEVTEILGRMIGDALQSSKPLSALIALNPSVAALNLSSAGLPSD